jgi:hypothetical protein
MDRIETLRSYRPDQLPFAEGTGISRIRNPHFDVGEFLPTPKKGETEFARISLASSTGDVFSLRIKKEKKSYVVTIVDEYNTEFIDYENKYDQIPTQGEVFDIITDMNNEPDSQPYWLAIIEQNGLDSIEQITDFIQIDSNIYPDLNELFEDYLVEKNFNNDENKLDGELSEEQISAIAELIKNNKEKSDWDSLMGTICFNIWHKTKHWFLKSKDIRFIDISFICALNLFQKWENIYLSNKFSLSEISKDASPYVVKESIKLKDSITNLKAFISVIKESGFGEKETSKHFVSLFAADLLNSQKFKDESINPLDYFQTGVEILCLFVLMSRELDKEFLKELLDIGDFESIVEEIIQDINYLNETES